MRDRATEEHTEGDRSTQDRRRPYRERINPGFAADVHFRSRLSLPRFLIKRALFDGDRHGKR